ncbi:MAG: threonine/serine dehydratase [Labedaea sp.]
MDLSLERIELAARTIDPVFRNSPQYLDQQLCAALGRRVLIKVETANPLRSFKGRGTGFLIGQLDGVRHLVTMSTGNFGQGVAYAARANGMSADVFTPPGISPVKLDRIRSFGAMVIEAGADGRTAKLAAREHAAGREGWVFVEDGQDPRIAEGAGTIAVELLAEHRPDTIVVPVGDGALITGIARWTKEFSPDTRIVGVCASGAPSMLHSWRAGAPVPSERADTIAEGIQISDPIAASVTRMHRLVDDVVLVHDAALLAAVRLAASTLGLLLEPAGAAGIAAIAEHDLPGELIATVLTGSNLRADHFPTL